MKKYIDDLTAAFVREILFYDPAAGNFTWRVSPSQRTKSGASAGCVKASGQVIISIAGRKYLASRIAWLYMTGTWPVHEVDHRDLDRKNNRWANLRHATGSQNCCNKRVRTDCLSGIKGVHWFSVTKKWRADIMLNGRRIFLGSFDDKETAAAAYAEAAKKFHGEFARCA